MFKLIRGNNIDVFFPLDLTVFCFIASLKPPYVTLLGAPQLQCPPGEAAQAEPESAPAHPVGPT